MPLPQIPSTRTKRAIWEIGMLWPIERMTEHLYSGAFIHDDDMQDIEAFIRRAMALKEAYSSRCAAAGLDREC